MKLLMCASCSDIFNLVQDVERVCSCGSSSGRYEPDGTHAVVRGPHAIPLGFANISINAALQARPQRGLGKQFVAFVIPRECPTVEHSTRPAGRLSASA